MKDFNAFMFVSHAASDLNGEFTDLENLMEQGGDKAREIGNAFQHLVSLIQGMEYTIDFIEDDEARHEIVEVIKEWQETLMGYRAGCMKIIYSKRMGQDFDILTNDFMTRLFEQARKSIIEESEANAKERKKYDEIMGDIKAIVNEVKDEDTANQALDTISGFEHALTSKKEAGAMLNAKAKELGLKYDPKARAYVARDGEK